MTTTNRRRLLPRAAASERAERHRLHPGRDHSQAAVQVNGARGDTVTSLSENDRALRVVRLRCSLCHNSDTMNSGHHTAPSGAEWPRSLCHDRPRGTGPPSRLEPLRGLRVTEKDVEDRGKPRRQVHACCQSRRPFPQLGGRAGAVVISPGTGAVGIAALQSHTYCVALRGGCTCALCRLLSALVTTCRGVRA